MNKIVYSLMLTGTLCSLSAFMSIAKEDANIRSKPSIDSEIVSILLAHDKIDVLEEVNISGWPWYKTSKGYISYELLELVESKEKFLENKSVITEKEIEPAIQEEETQVQKQAEPQVAIENVVVVQEVVAKEEETIVEEIIQIKTQIMSQEKEVAQVEKDSQPKYNYFVGVELNYNQLSVNKTNIVGDIILNKELDDSASSVSFQVGTKLENYVLSANYEVVNLDDVNMYSLYLSLDFEFDMFLTPFLGISLGMSNLQWQTDPLVNSKTKDEKLSSLMYGVQAGISYQLYKNWSIYSRLSYQKIDFKTTLTSIPAKADVTHEDKASVGVGVRYSF